MRLTVSLIDALPLNSTSVYSCTTTMAKNQECKVLGFSAEEEAKQASAPIPDDLGVDVRRQA